MLIQYEFDRPKLKPYKQYRGDRFNKAKEKIRLVINGIQIDTRLSHDDKQKLISEIKNYIEHI